MSITISGVPTSNFDYIIILDSANGYIQLPKLTNIQRNALAAVNGMEIYNSDTDQMERYANGYWIPVQNRNQLEQSALFNFGMNPVISDDNAKTFMHSLTNIARSDNWNRMNMSTAQGGTELGGAYIGATYDGRYVYYVPQSSITLLRFDTQGTSFITAADWQRMSLSTAQGSAAVAVSCQGACFDGRYVYYGPRNSDTFLRFDTQGTSFTTAADWQTMSMSTAQGAAALDTAYTGARFDGRYVYYTPRSSDTFLRFDTQGTSFTTTADWQRMSMSTAQGAAALDDAYQDLTFDGRYIYYSPFDSDTFLRFDTQGTSFTTTADWQKTSMSTAQGAAAVDNAYNGSAFDGRYIYYSPSASATFLRFDTQGTSFTTAGDWQQMSMSTAQGAAAVVGGYVRPTFDGRYIYYVAYNSDTFLRFDTQGTSFTTVGDWQRMSMSTAQGGAALNTAYQGATFDGKYIYYAPDSANTFVRVMASPVRL